MTMTEAQKIRAIVQQEIQASKSSSRFGLNTTQRHTHNGIDSPRINSGNLTPGLKTTGAVTFSQVNQIYKFNVNFTPTLIQLTGIATNTGAGYRALVIGQAALGQNLYFQPDTSQSVKVGGKFEIVQSYAQFLYNDGTGLAHATTDDQHILSVTDGSTIFARATVTSYGQNFFTVYTDNLESGWTINASYFVT